MPGAKRFTLPRVTSSIVQGMIHTRSRSKEQISIPCIHALTIFFQKEEDYPPTAKRHVTLSAPHGYGTHYPTCSHKLCRVSGGLPGSSDLDCSDKFPATCGYHCLPGARQYVALIPLAMAVIGLIGTLISVLTVSLLSGIHPEYGHLRMSARESHVVGTVSQICPVHA